MDFKGQTAVLSAIFVLVGMMFLVPAITEKALAIIKASATGTCGPEGQTHPCEFALYNQVLRSGKWDHLPTHCGTSVSWVTTGNPLDGNEEGSVFYWVGAIKSKLQAALEFYNPESGSNKCDVVIVSGQGQLSGTCHAGPGIAATFTYTLRSVK